MNTLIKQHFVWRQFEFRIRATNDHKFKYKNMNILITPCIRLCIYYI